MIKFICNVRLDRVDYDAGAEIEFDAARERDLIRLRLAEAINSPHGAHDVEDVSKHVDDEDAPKTAKKTAKRTVRK